MVDQTVAMGTSGAEVEPDTASRGSLTIADQVIEKVAIRSALDVASVVRHQGGVGAILGSRAGRSAFGTDLPRATVETFGPNPRITLAIAVEWPCAVAETSRGVREHVFREVERLTGTQPGRVDVTVSRVVPGASDARRKKGFIELPAPGGDSDRALESASLPGEESEESTAQSEGSRPNVTAERRQLAPSGLPGSAIGGVMLAVLLLGVAVAAGRDLAVRFGWLRGEQWSVSAARWLRDNDHWQWWMWPTAVGLVLAGLALFVLAAKPRRQTHVKLARNGQMWTRCVDLARRTSAVVGAIEGVAQVSTVVTRRALVCTVVPAREGLDRDEVRRAAEAVAGEVESPPKVRVRVRSRSGGSR